MPLQPQQVKEINFVIEKIEKALKPDHEIGAQSKVILKNLLAANKIDRVPLFYKCRREHSEQIVSHFVNEKKTKKSRFHGNAQEFIFLV